MRLPTRSESTRSSCFDARARLGAAAGMKPAPFELVRPTSLDEALAALAEHGDEAKPLAGGQSLVPVLNMRLLRPAVLVDLNRVRGLDGVERDNGTLRLGALVRQRALERSSEVVHLPLVGD